MCIQCHPPPSSSLSPLTRVFFFPYSETLSLPPPPTFFHSFPCYFLDNISPIVPPSNIVARGCSCKSRPEYQFFHSPSNTFYPTRTFPTSRYSFFFPPSPSIDSLLYFRVSLFSSRLWFTDVAAESSIFSPGLDSYRGCMCTLYVHALSTCIYVYRALVFRVFIASYHLSFPRLFWGAEEGRKEGEGWLVAADRSPFPE